MTISYKIALLSLVVPEHLSHTVC